MAWEPEKPVLLFAPEFRKCLVRQLAKTLCIVPVLKRILAPIWPEIRLEDN